MSRDRGKHWEETYRSGHADAVSWFESVPRRSLELIRATGVSRDAPIVDIGGGMSHLVDCLLSAGYTDLSVLDIAPAALAQARARLGAIGNTVEWLAVDVTEFQPRRQYAVWHDRATLHFLVTAQDRRRYLEALAAALAPRGHVVLATFGPQGPQRCSGFPVSRYSSDTLGEMLGPDLELRRSELAEHRTPDGRLQQFLYGWWQRGASGRSGERAPVSG